MCINKIKLKLENQAVITLITYTCKNYTTCCTCILFRSGTVCVQFVNIHVNADVFFPKVLCP
jgi:hypothetical protein